MSLKYLDVSNFDTSKVTNMRGVFRNCIYLTSVDVSNWDTSNVTDMSMMFY
ncbi:BspA family leucine-rich repeat surface protein [bacterium]|nr:BspA family leucine-rich repeat surface protein [bacterium]